ncbi:MAG TPA: hypothetical protein VGE60_10440 [Telluria sp.]
MPPARSHAGLAALFAAMCALAFGLAALLYGVRLEQTLAQVEASRVRFTLADLRADFEKSLDRGYAIGQLANAQAALEAEARQDPGILSLTVKGPDGRPLFHAGAALPAEAPLPDRDLLRGRDAITAATPLTYNYGALAGTLVMRYSNASHDAIMRAIAVRLALAASAATILSSIVFVRGLRALDRRRLDLAGQVERALEAVRMPHDMDAEVNELVDKVNKTSATALVELTAARHAMSQPEAAR